VPQLVEMTGLTFDEIENKEVIVYRLTKKTSKSTEWIDPPDPMTNHDLLLAYINSYVSAVKKDSLEYPDLKYNPLINAFKSQIAKRGLKTPQVSPDFFKIKKKSNSVIIEMNNKQIVEFNKFMNYNALLMHKLLNKELQHRSILLGVTEKSIIHENLDQQKNLFSNKNNSDLMVLYVDSYMLHVEINSKSYPNPTKIPELKDVTKEIAKRGLKLPQLPPNFFRIKKLYSSVILEKNNEFVEEYNKTGDSSALLKHKLLYKELQHRESLQEENGESSQDYYVFKLILFVIIVIIGLYMVFNE